MSISPCTIYAFCVKQLEDLCLHEFMIEAVMKIAVEDMTQMQGRWSDNTTEYDLDLVNCIFLNVKMHARDYIKEHHPMAWFAPALEPGVNDMTPEQLDNFITEFRNNRKEKVV